MQLDEKSPGQTEVSRKPSLKFLSLFFVLLALLVVGVVYFWFRHNDNPKQVPIYSYSKVTAVHIEGREQNSGMAFNKPVELTQISSAQGQIELEHLKTLANSKKKMISYIAAASSVAHQSITQVQLDALNKQITNSKSFNQSSYSLSSLNTFLKDRLPEGWSITLDPGLTFKNSYIRKNAWSFSLIAKDPKTTQELDGEVFYAISHANHYYYLVIVSQPIDWRSNSRIWNTTLSSIRIDQ